MTKTATTSANMAESPTGSRPLSSIISAELTIIQVASRPAAHQSPNVWFWRQGKTARAASIALVEVHS